MDDVLAYLSHFELHRAAVIALAQIVLIDITLAGDNALVIGMTASRVGSDHRRKVIFLGLLAALVLRIAFAFLAVELLGFVGVKLAGGALLLWVSGRLYTDITRGDDHDARAGDGKSVHVGLLRAVGIIMAADVSMSLDNVLAVAGVAQPLMATDPWILFVGLALSVALMGVAAAFIARMLRRWPWIAFVGVGLIVYVSVRMIAEGGGEIFKALHAL